MNTRKRLRQYPEQTDTASTSTSGLFSAPTPPITPINSPQQQPLHPIQHEDPEPTVKLSEVLALLEQHHREIEKLEDTINMLGGRDHLRYHYYMAKYAFIAVQKAQEAGTRGFETKEGKGGKQVPVWIDTMRPVPELPTLDLHGRAKKQATSVLQMHEEVTEALAAIEGKPEEKKP